MSIKVQQEVPAIILLTLVLITFVVYTGKKMREFAANDVYAKPSGFAFVGLSIISFISDLISSSMSKKGVKTFGAIVCTLTLYLFTANLSGLFGFATPTMNLSVNISLAFVTWFLIQFSSIKSNGIGGYIRGFFEPMPFFVFGNILSKFSPIVSLSMRLFGNILSGAILMSLVYSATSALSNLLFGWISSFNIFGVLLAPILHIYFDVFSGCIQMYIFIALTIAFVGSEYSEN